MTKGQRVKKRKKKPYKLDSYKKRAWIEAYGKSKSIVGACQATNITRQTIYDELERDKKFKEQKQAIDESFNDIVENRLFSMTSDNVTACIFWLCNRKGDKWKNVNKKG